MEILRDSFLYFSQRPNWRSTPTTLSGLERCHKIGMQAMTLLIQSHLKRAGQAVRPKRKKSSVLEETAPEVSIVSLRRAALKRRRKLLKAIRSFILAPAGCYFVLFFIFLDSGSIGGGSTESRPAEGDRRV